MRRGSGSATSPCRAISIPRSWWVLRTSCRPTSTTSSRAQGRALQERLGIPVYVGMRHGAPLIKDVVEEARKDGIDRLVGIALAPQYSRVSVGAYHAELEKTGMPCVKVESWHREPALLEYWRRASAGKDFVLFTAHSIPTEGAEPYPTQLGEMVKEIVGGP